uniref:Allatostatin A n=1 Tax=Grapholita molesta TaxID=192188 RepID=A0A7D7L023_GRAMO|nr:allatostatin A [Grapholita molesta]
MLYTYLSVWWLVIVATLCAPEHAPSEHDPHTDAREPQESSEAHVAPLEKRSPHYNFGLGKRAYSYVSEYKRLPVYNFGLGKRSRPYSFGLGKRSISEEDQDEELTNDIEQVAMDRELFDQYEDAPVYEEKRARPYSFGLGKRFTDDLSEDKRKMYDFGLGKRLPLYNFGLGKRARQYDFGLGKRYSGKFNFGLGKRERDMHRFNFGLGKRSIDDSYDSVEE